MVALRNRNAVVVAALVVGAAAAPRPSAAAPGRIVHNTDLGSPELDLGQFLVARGVLDPGVETQLTTQHNVSAARSAPGWSIVELRGTTGSGIPLSRSIARALVDDSSGRVSIAYSLGEIGPLPDADATVDASAALAAVATSGYSGAFGATTAHLVVVPQPDRSRLAWRVDPPASGTPLANRSFFVDARSGEVWVEFDQIATADVLSFATDPLTTPDAALFPLVSIDVGATQLTGPRLLGRSCVFEVEGKPCSPVALASADLDGNFIVPIPTRDHSSFEDAFAEVSAYYHADKFLEHLRVHGFEQLPCESSGLPSVLVANFRTSPGIPLDNAGYTGDCAQTFIFGQGQHTDFAYDGDIVYHEVGHAVIDALLGDGSLVQPRLRGDALAADAIALNEAFADYLSSSYTGDSTVGAYIGSSTGQSVRDNLNGYKCPVDLTGEAHDDSEPFAAVLFELYEVHGSQVTPVVLDSLALLGSDATFEEGAAIVIAMMEVAFGEVGALDAEAAFEARGLVDCPRVVPWGSVGRSLRLSPPTGLTATPLTFTPFVPPPYQIEVSVPASAHAVEVAFAVTELLDGPGYDLAARVKFDAPIAFSYDATQSPVVVADDSDTVVEIEGDSATIDVPPGSSALYLAFTNRGPNIVRLGDFSVEVDVEDPPDSASTGSQSDPSSTGTSDGTAGIPDAPDGSTRGGTSGPQHDEDSVVDGCSCTQAGGTSASWALIVLWATRRRRHHGRTAVANLDAAFAASTGCPSLRGRPTPVRKREATADDRSLRPASLHRVGRVVQEGRFRP